MIDISAPARGAYIRLEDLIALRFPARQLRLSARSRALSALAGPNKSNFRGRGIDFEEVRSYQAGDDIRSIDWRVTARTGSAHTKMFREERERPVLVAIDQRSSMFFGSRHCLKSVLAAQLAGLCAWSALEGGDRVGGLVFNGEQHREIRPRRSRNTVLALLSEIVSYNAMLPLQASNPEDSFSIALTMLRRIAKPGSSIILISDFQGTDVPQVEEHLFQLTRHCELAAIACADPLELQLPRAGRYIVTDGNRRSELYTANRAMRRDYERQFVHRRESLKLSLGRLGVPLLESSTDRPPFALLQQFYGVKGR